MFVLLSLTVALVSSFEYSTEWEAWKAQHGKKYASKELELVRQEIFESNMKFVEEHNKNADKHGFTTAMNEFGDLVSNGRHVVFAVILTNSTFASCVDWLSLDN